MGLWGEGAGLPLPPAPAHASSCRSHLGPFVGKPCLVAAHQTLPLLRPTAARGACRPWRLLPEKLPLTLPRSLFAGQVRQQGDGLDGLAQTHLVGQDACMRRGKGARRQVDAATDAGRAACAPAASLSAHAHTHRRPCTPPPAVEPPVVQGRQPSPAQPEPAF